MLPEAARTTVLSIAQHSVGLNEDTIAVDVAQFETLLAQCDAHVHADTIACEECLARMESAATLYRGKLLEGTVLENSPTWEAWLYFKCEDLHRQALNLLYTLTRAAEARGAYVTMRQYAQRQITLEPWREEAHRQVMRALALGGEHVAALAAFETCRRMLGERLGVEPAAETVELFRLIESGELRPVQVQAPSQIAPELARVRSHLPVPLTNLLGRERELGEIANILRDPACRCVTLVGTGGVGKTHLASQIAANMRDAYADGVFFVALTTVRDAHMVIPAIARVLHVPQSGMLPLGDVLKDALRSCHMLLVLDNFEHVADAAPVVDELLAAAPRLNVLVTSRIALHLPAVNTSIMVAPLAIAEPHASLTPEAWEHLPSVQLFAERARAIQPLFRLTPQNVVDIAPICAVLDGLPLAIELAAARIKIMKPNELLRRLHAARLPILTQGARDLPQRHQTLRDAIDWSYRLLDPAQQRMFALLSVFAGSWTVSAAHDICEHDQDPSDTFDRVRALLDHSLITRATDWTTQTENDEPRFTMLKTIGEYARERIAEHEEQCGIEARHAAFFLHLAKDAERVLGTHEQIPWLPRLDIDHNNLLKALTWFLDGNDAASGLRMAQALIQYWARRALYTEGRYWLELALVRTEATVPDSENVRSTALYGAGWLASLQGENAHAMKLYEESITAVRDGNDPARPAVLRVYQARTLRLQGKHERAAMLEQESLTLFRAVGDTKNIAFALLSLGDVAYDQGDLSQAERSFAEALRLYESIGNIEDTGWVLKCLGEVAHMQGQLDCATARLQQSLAIFRDVYEMTGVAQVQLVLGQVAHTRGDYGEALRLYHDSLRLLFEYGLKIDVAYILEALPTVTALSAVDATMLFGAAAAMRAESDLPRPQILSDTYEGAVAWLRSQLSPSAFNTAWARGETMPLERVVAFALSHPVARMR